jgi:hypothetical protein
VNKVLLTGRLTRDPEMRSLASSKNVTTVSVSIDATRHASRAARQTGARPSTGRVTTRSNRTERAPGLELLRASRWSRSNPRVPAVSCPQGAGA